MNDLRVFHPLDDVPEVKRNVDQLGPMRMTRAVRFSLYTLRAYVILMLVLLVYHLLDLAGALTALAGLLHRQSEAMSIPDVINGAFEVSGGILNWLNVSKLAKDQCVKGVYWPITCFFAIWGLWNLFYYPSLKQWASFTGGLVIVTGNLAWVILAMKYRRHHD